MPYTSTNYCLCKHWTMKQVLILLIFFSDIYKFQAISMRDAIISSWKLCIYLPFINIQLDALCICCKYWYCWFFFLTFTGSRPFRRGTPSSPVENCMYLPSIYKYSIKCLMHMLQVLILLILFSDFYRFQAILMRDAIITSWKLYVCTFHL